MAQQNLPKLSIDCLQAIVLTILALAVCFFGFAHAAETDKLLAQTDAQIALRDLVAGRLKAAYPDFVSGTEGNDVVFKDGTRLPLEDGAPNKPFEVWLASPDIRDMFELPYPSGSPAATQPAKNFDPGRARNAAFFEKIYGDCRQPKFKTTLVKMSWLPKKSNQTLIVTSLNGVAAQLKAISEELDRLPARFDPDLIPMAGAFNCRTIAGTNQTSAHAYGIAVDIALRHAHYWRWAAGGPDGPVIYRNSIPMEIVKIFEAHGFIWGGRWYHYDTMHFEYRPELLGTSAAKVGP